MAPFLLRYQGIARFGARPGHTTNVDRNQRLATLAFVTNDKIEPKSATLAFVINDKSEPKSFEKLEMYLNLNISFLPTESHIPRVGV